jgi:hypothetical protein
MDGVINTVAASSSVFTRTGDGNLMPEVLQQLVRKAEKTTADVSKMGQRGAQ